MTQQIKTQAPPLHPRALITRMLLGAGVALLVILYFVLGVDEPNPAWGKFWMIRPLIVMPLAGATGGAIFYFLDRAGYKGGWRKALAIIAGTIIYIIGLWMGIVLGLHGTMWN